MFNVELVLSLLVFVKSISSEWDTQFELNTGKDGTYKVFCNNASNGISDNYCTTIEYRRITYKYTEALMNLSTNAESLISAKAYVVPGCDFYQPCDDNYLQDRVCTGRPGDKKLVPEHCLVIRCLHQKANTFRCENNECILCANYSTPYKDSNQKQTPNINFVATGLHNIVNFTSQTGEKSVKEMNKIRNLTSEVIGKFEQNAFQLARQENGTNNRTEYNNSVALTIQVIALPSTSTQDVYRIKFDDELTDVRIPVDRISKSFNVSNLKIVIARWEGISGNLVSQSCPSYQTTNCSYAPTNTSLITVNYFDVTNATDPKVLTNLPVDYSIDLSGDFSQLYGDRPPFARISSAGWICVWWDENKRDWSEDGCEQENQNTFGKTAKCICNHTTTFSVLLSHTRIEQPTWLITTTLVLEGICIVALCITIVYVIATRISNGPSNQHSSLYGGNLRNNRTMIQVFLCFMLMSLHLLLIFADQALDNAMACYWLAAVTHATVISSALWLLNEGVVVTLKTHRNMALKMNYKLLSACQICLSFLVPVIIVGVTVAIAGDDYLEVSLGYKLQEGKDSDLYYENVGLDYPKYNNCIVNKTWVVQTITIPLAVIIVLNIFLLLRTIIVVYKLSKRDNEQRSIQTSESNCPLQERLQKHSHWKSVIKAFCLLLPVSSAPWIIHYLQDLVGASIVFSVISVSFNGLQGVGIFFVYCVANKEDRNNVKRMLKRSKLKLLVDRVITSLQQRSNKMHNNNGRKRGRVPTKPHIATLTSVTPRSTLEASRGSNPTVITDIPMQSLDAIER
ncbi:uncharacterized protein LOC143461700 isoform X1 [Clavelina lepadiformis]|uniref:uncharacterized protein LOC143461700 isoform X1 n=1 Tax=Clavelina lepadiformis TaxID=159417 RepID=UPI0040435995